MSLVDVLNQLNAVDEELTKEAEEMNKLAAEEEAAGRIMARGFLDELRKLGADNMLPDSGIKTPSKASLKAQDAPQKDIMRGENKALKPLEAKPGTGEAGPGQRPPSVVSPGREAGTVAGRKMYAKNVYGPQGGSTPAAPTTLARR